MSKRGLFVVVADLDAENAIKTLLTQRQSALGIALDFSPIPPPNGDLLRYSGRDSGCYVDAVDLLRPPQRTHHHALLCFDWHGCGAENQTREKIEGEVESLLYRNGWAEGDVAVIVINPELEAWAWVDSSETASAMGWDEGMNDLRQHLVGKGLWRDGEAKPSDPKTAMKEAVRVKRLRGGTAPLFAKLGKTIPFDSCVDPAFNKFRDALRRWFPQ